MYKKVFSVFAMAMMLLTVSACSDGSEVAAKAPAKSSAQTSQAAPAKVAKQPGERFIRIAQPVNTANPDKIEVAEVFWYGCGHCFDFEPMLATWEKKLPNDVEVRRSPGMWSQVMVLHATAFYTAQALGVLEQVHQPIFDAINLKKNPLRDRDAIEKIFLAHSDVDAESFRKTFASFGVSSQVKQADARARSYGISGTPELIINGKYRVTGRSAGSRAGMLEVAEQLIAQERSARQ